MKFWIARDADNTLRLFQNRPEKWDDMWMLGGGFSCVEDWILPNGINPQWSDYEPIEIEIEIRKAIEEGGNV